MNVQDEISTQDDKQSSGVEQRVKRTIGVLEEKWAMGVLEEKWVGKGYGFNKKKKNMQLF